MDRTWSEDLQPPAPGSGRNVRFGEHRRSQKTAEHHFQGALARATGCIPPRFAGGRRHPETAR